MTTVQVDKIEMYKLHGFVAEYNAVIKKYLMEVGVQVSKDLLDSRDENFVLTCLTKGHVPLGETELFRFTDKMFDGIRFGRLKTSNIMEQRLFKSIHYGFKIFDGVLPVEKRNKMVGYFILNMQMVGNANGLEVLAPGFEVRDLIFRKSGTLADSLSVQSALLNLTAKPYLINELRWDYSHYSDFMSSLSMLSSNEALQLKGGFKTFLTNHLQYIRKSSGLIGMALRLAKGSFGGDAEVLDLFSENELVDKLSFETQKMESTVLLVDKRVLHRNLNCRSGTDRWGEELGKVGISEVKSADAQRHLSAIVKLLNKSSKLSTAKIHGVFVSTMGVEKYCFTVSHYHDCKINIQEMLESLLRLKEEPIKLGRDNAAELAKHVDKIVGKFAIQAEINEVEKNVQLGMAKSKKI